VSQLTTHVRINKETKLALDSIGEANGLRSIDDVIKNLIAFKRDRDFWEQCERGELALRNDPIAWAEEQAERALWDNTLSDGLTDA